MYCIECGHQVSEEIKFCPKCGFDQTLVANAQVEVNTYAKQKKSTPIKRVVIYGLGTLVLLFIIVGVIAPKNDSQQTARESSAAQVKEAVLPSFTKGEPYSIVRQKMLAAGWNQYTSETSICSDAMSPKLCEEWSELEVCTQEPFKCKFNWLDGQRLTIIETYGGDKLYESFSITRLQVTKTAESAPKPNEELAKSEPVSTPLIRNENEKSTVNGLVYREAMLKKYKNGDIISFVGKVAQIEKNVFGDDVMRISTKPFSNSGYLGEDVFLKFNKNIEVVAKDIVNVIGKYDGTTTYTTVLRAEIEVPVFKLVSINVAGGNKNEDLPTSSKWNSEIGEDMNWYGEHSITHECFKNDGPGDMIKNMQTLGERYSTANERKIENTVVQVTVNFESRGASATYYRGLLRCQAMLASKMGSKNSEVNRYK